MSDQGQQLRQCSPMGVLISAQERFSVYRQARDAELDRRYQEYLQNPKEGSPWPEVKAGILGQ